MKNVRVWVKAEPEDETGLIAAVREGGAEVVGPDEATAIIWATDDPASIRPFLTSDVTWVQLSWAGVEEWFARGLIDESRLWTAAKGVYAEPIAEYAVAMMLAAARRLPEMLAVKSWRPLEMGMIRGKSIGLIGAGEIGKAILRLLPPFGVQTMALTRSGRIVPGADESVGLQSLDYLLGASDFVIIAAPETRETVGLLSKEKFALMRPGAWLLNVGRGSSVETKALVEALTEGDLGGAILDVTDPEPLPDEHPLWRLPNVIITSHTSNTPRLGSTRFAERVRENVERHGRGQPLLGIVDIEKQY